MNLCKLLFIHGILTSPSTIKKGRKANYFEGRNRESKDWFEIALLYFTILTHLTLTSPAAPAPVWELALANKISQQFLRKKRSNTAKRLQN